MNTKLSGSLVILLANLIFTAGNVSAVPTWAQSFGATSVYNDGTVELGGDHGPGYDYPIGITQMPDGGVGVAGFLDLRELIVGNPPAGADASGALVGYAPGGGLVWRVRL